ncbi:MAG: zf-TFIIB domain-containing protein [Bacteroidetes bacterium]|nr:zf-TFIIB domain-containing protein [Bacteroidota bacterium]
MRCPSCKSAELIKTERQGFLIDYCPDCRGIWFERGELDKIMQKLGEIDIPVQTKKEAEKIPETQKEKSSPIMDSIYASKELHHLHNLPKDKHPHWIHRLFD